MKRATGVGMLQLAQREAAKHATVIQSVTGNVTTDRQPVWMKATACIMALVMYLAPAVFLCDEVAHAATIVDPRAPIAFQPTVTQTSTGVAAISIATPNANGISVNSYQSFNVDSSGLVLNNSLTPGTPLLGGTLPANPNLAGRAASVIVNQVTSTGPVSVLAGPLEVFGSPASIIISNPNGVSVNGLSLTNASGLALTTGTPQFLTGAGGTSTDFTHAGALAFNVTSGNVTIGGPAGVNGPGAGIEGTVGNIDVIAQTINLNAPLRADQRVNLIAGNQLVNPASVDASGTAYGAAANGTANTATAVGRSVAIDANQFGSVTSGQIYVMSTAAGMGVNTLGALAATAGNVSVSANGDITTGATVANQSVNLASAGNTTITATGQANQNYTVAANGAINATGAVLAGQNVAMSAGTDLNATTVAANGSANLVAGGSMSVDTLSAGTANLAATSGNLTLGAAVMVPGALQAVAGQNLTVNGAVQGGSTVVLTGGQNVTVNGAVAGVGDVSLSAQGGTASTAGTVATDGQLTVAGQQGVTLGGTVSAQGDVSIASVAGNVSLGGALSTPGQVAVTAGQDASVAGNVHSGQSTSITATRDVSLDGGLEVDGSGNATVNAGRDLAGTGAASVANDATLTAGRNLSMSGAIQTGNDLIASATQNVLVGATTAVGAATFTATNGSVTLSGDALSGSDMKVSAGTEVSTQGAVLSLGNLNLDAQSGSLTAQGAVSASGATTLNAAQNLALNGQTTVSGDATLSGTNIETQGLAVGGNLSATAQGSLDTSGGQLNAVFSSSAPALSVTGNATLSGANVTTANAAIGGAYSVTGTASLTTGGTAAYQGNARLTGGTVTNVGLQMAAGNLTVSGSSVINQGSLSSLQTTTVDATDLNNSGSIYGPSTALNVSNSTTNSGALLATTALTLTATSLNNSNGLIFAGDVNNPTSPVGDATINVNGGNGSFTNTNGQILAQHALTANLLNQAINPSAAASGTLNGGSAFNLSAQSVNNTGTWVLPGTVVTVSASQGISNTGTVVQGAGTLTLNGAASNASTIAAQNLTVNGSLANQVGATVQAGDAFTLNGSGSNTGTVEAVNTLSITGSSFDNSNGTTRAGAGSTGTGNLNIHLTGDLGNAGGTLTATNDLTITANSIVNSESTTATTTTTTTSVLNAPLVMTTVIGTETAFAVASSGSESGLEVLSKSVPVTIGGVLAPAGVAVGTISISQVSRDTVPTDAAAQSPVATTGQVQYIRVDSSTNGGSALWFVQDGTLPTSDSNGVYAVQTLTVPTVTETRTEISAGGSGSVIAAGHDLNLSANSLVNQGGTVSAANDVNMNVQSLANGGSTYTSTVTDAVDIASLNAFLAGLQAMQHAGSVSVRGSGNASGSYQCDSGCLVGPVDPPTSFVFSAPGTVAAQTVSSSVTLQSPVGQIVAGHNLNLSGGNLTNAGSLVTGNDVNISAASFTNQGTNTGTMTTTAGCESGYSAGCGSASTTNPNSQTYSYQQINSNVTAGHDIVIAAGMVNNTYGNLIAAHDVVIGGAGTSAASPTQAANVTNTSGSIEAGNDVHISAASLINTIATPVQIHQNYGSATPFTGCTSNCEAYVDVQSAGPATITANHNVTLQVGSFSNTGSLVTGLNNVTINATGSASSGNQYLSAYWASNLVHFGTSYAAWGCASNPSLCQTLYGSAYASGAAQDPAGLPSSVGLADFVPGTIQAGNTLSVNSPTLTNTGNVLGQTVALTGAQLVNGITNPNLYTPSPAISGQVISLGPPPVPGSATTTVNSVGLVTTLSGQRTSVTGAAGLPSNSPIGVQTVGTPTAPTVQQVAGTGANSTYLVNSPATPVVGALAPGALLAALPSNLQPGSVPFYYDPYTENQQIEQAALQATGKTSFYSSTYTATSATDSTSQVAIENQDKAALYGAALQYAEQNNVALGTQLSDAQLALVNEPMLWYVEQTVPQPGCTATGNGVCPTVQALMPEVLLPKNFAQVTADGEITGTNVTLNYANSILNTGSVSAQNLTVNTGKLTNEERLADVGTIYQAAGDAGIAKTTGTVVQSGGFMTAANYTLNADTINQIGGALQQVNADGSIDATGTQALLANLKGQLGGNFMQSTASDDLNTTYITNGSSLFESVFSMVVIAFIAVASAGAMSGVVGAGAGATAGSGSLFSAAGASVDGVAVGAGLGNIAVSAGIAAMESSAMRQEAFSDSFSLDKMLEAGGTAFLTAGLTNGITINDGGAGWTWMGGNTDSLASLAGVQSVGNTLVPTAGASSGSLLAQGLGVLGEAGIQSGVQSTLGGGSFLTAFQNALVNDLAAAGAYAIGQANSSDIFGRSASGELAYIATHGLLGCAAGAATGTGCESGALGAATSAAFSADLMAAMDPSGAPLDAGQMAVLAAFATLVGGSAAGLAGGNVQAGATWAQNEALNNDANDPQNAAQGGLGKIIGTALLNYVTVQLQFGAAMADTVESTIQGYYSAVTHTNAPQSPGGDPSQSPGSSNPPPTAGGGAAAVIQGLVAAECTEFSVLCGGVMPPVPATGTSGYGPENATLSSNGDGNSRSSTSGNGSSATNSGNPLSNATYAQTTYSNSFSSQGAFAGQTVSDVANALQSGALSPADVPIQYIVQDGNTLILNTRSAQALEQAGIPRSQWSGVDVTGDAAAQARLAGQLLRNGLTSQGTATVTPTGGSK